MAERLRGARHRLDPARVRRPRNRGQRSGPHRVLMDYVMYYMRSRTHLLLGKDTPSPLPITPPSAGRTVAIPEVGSLHHPYERIAA